MRKPPVRHGAVLPLVTVCLIALFAFAALAIDIGIMAVGRTQCQNAADVASLAGTRTLDGRSSDNNRVLAEAEAREAAKANLVLSEYLVDGEVTSVRAGIYRYDTSAKRFQAVFDTAPAAEEAYGAMQVTVTTQQPTYFGRLLGINSLRIGATATAVHRPRDVAIVLDFSDPMGYASTNRHAGKTLNPDDRFPRFGPWSVFGAPGMVLDPNNPGESPANLNTYVPPTPMQRVFPYVDAGGEAYGPTNLTIATRHGPAVVGQFTLSDNTTKAFVRAGGFPSFPNVRTNPGGYSGAVCTPAPPEFANQNADGFVGDKFPLRNGVSVSGTTAPTADQYAHTAADYLEGRSAGITRAGVTDATYDADFERDGYDFDFASRRLKPAAERLQGFTMGPGYWGKTFYLWPPDPRSPTGQIGEGSYVPGDWRRRFFKPRAGSTQDLRDNAVLWNSGTGITHGLWRDQAPGANAAYIVNYDIVLAWLKRGPQTLPASLRAGRIIYYDSIPDTIPVDDATGFVQASATGEQRFWKDYIDFVLGSGRFDCEKYLCGANEENGNTRNGARVHYNAPLTSRLDGKITPRSTLVAAAGAGPVPYMRYDDRPLHPRAQFWFGPWTMLCYLQEPGGNWLPGNCYEAQCWQLKAGINSALTDIKSNHPNDQASLIYFSGSNKYNKARVPMGRDYTRMQNALFYPFSMLDRLGTTSAALWPYFPNDPTGSSPSGFYSQTEADVPNAGSQTCPEMGLRWRKTSSAWPRTGRRPTAAAAGPPSW